jgi:hypothetical protein
MGPVKIPMQLAPFFVRELAVTAFVTFTTAIALAALVLSGPVIRALLLILHAEAETRPDIAGIRERRQQYRNHSEQCEQLFHQTVLQ